MSKHCKALIFGVDILELYYITYLFLNCLYLGLLVTTVQCSGMCVSVREHPVGRTCATQVLPRQSYHYHALWG